LTESACAAFAGSKFDWSRTAVTASTPLMVSEDEREAVAAVVGLQMTYARFHEHFVNATRLCPRDFAASADTAAAASCNLTCASPVNRVSFAALFRDTPSRRRVRVGFKCVEAMGRIIIRGPYPPSNAIIYMHLQL